MFVKQVKKFDGYEADLIVSDGEYELLCYSYHYPPFKEIPEGRAVKDIISLRVGNIKRVDGQDYIIRKESGDYPYFLQGKVLDADKRVIAIGKITIKLDKPLDKSIKQGDFLEFTVQRLDCTL